MGGRVGLGNERPGVVGAGQRDPQEVQREVQDMQTRKSRANPKVSSVFHTHPSQHYVTLHFTPPVPSASQNSPEIYAAGTFLS